jgi:soluble cytochrome b562
MTTTTLPEAITAEAIPMADVTKAVQTELTRLAALAVDIQESCGEALVQAAMERPEILAKAQGLDLLTQHLAGVADFLEALAPHLPPDWSVDTAPAARAVRLSDLSAQLGGHPVMEALVEDLETFF